MTRTLAVAIVVVGALAGQAHASLGRECPDKNQVMTRARGCVSKQALFNEQYRKALTLIQTDPKKALELFELGCKQNHGPSCSEAGILHYSGRVRMDAATRIPIFSADKAKAFKLWERACELGDGFGCEQRGYNIGGFDNGKPWYEKGCAKNESLACARLGWGYEHYVTPVDPKKAKKLYDQALKIAGARCPGDGQSCWVSAYLYEQGIGVAADQVKARGLYVKSCGAGYGAGCAALASMLKHASDAAGALDAYEKACQYDYADACGRAAIMLENADPDHKTTKPLELARHGCELDPAKCYEYAEMFRVGAGTKADDATATKVYNEACKGGSDYACVVYARRVHENKGAKRDRAAENDLLDKACNADEYYGCELLASYLDHDDKPDGPRALKAADRGCKGGRQHACYIHGFLIGHNRRGGAKLDDAVAAKEAAPSYAKACQAGSSFGCHELANLEEHGLGVDKDAAKALEHHRVACDAASDPQGESCAAIARLVGTTGKDRAMAIRAIARACTHGVDASCWAVNGEVKNADEVTQADTELAAGCKDGQRLTCYVRALVHLHGNAEQKHSGVDQLGKLCTAKVDIACALQGLAIYNGEGGAPADHEKGKQLMRRACDDEMGQACLRLSLVYENDEKNGAEGLRYAEQGCKLKIADACSTAGFILYTAPKGVQWDIKRAAEFYIKGCDLDSAMSCSNAAEMYRYGIITKPDPQRAYELYKKSCAAGASAGCTGEAHYIAGGEGGAKKDVKRAIELDRKACEDAEQPSSEACFDLAVNLRAEKGSMSEIARMEQRAFDLTKKQAETNPEYMYWLGTFYRDGMATMKDDKKAREWFIKACDGFDPLGCMAAAKVLGASTLPGDRERARVYYHHACVAGMEDGCKGEELMKAPGQAAEKPAPGKVKAKGCGGCTTGGGATGLVALALVVAAVLRRRRR